MMSIRPRKRCPRARRGGGRKRIVASDTIPADGTLGEGMIGLFEVRSGGTPRRRPRQGLALIEA
jgi:hypothetical protein